MPQRETPKRFQQTATLYPVVIDLEVDCSTEPHETLALRCFGYQDYYRRGGLAVRYGHSPEEYKDFPFRVLLVLQNEERRNNGAVAQEQSAGS